MNIIDSILYSKLELNNLPYDLDITTTTITCHLDIIFNVENIGKNFDNFDEYIIGKKYGDRTINNLITVKKLKSKKNKKKEKKNFYNQVSIIFCTFKLEGFDINKISKKDKYKTLNVKLFNNGSIQMTGCKNLDNIIKSIEILFSKFRENNEKYNYYEGELDIKKINRFKIQMINTNFDMNFKINRNNLHNILLKNNYDTSYDPIIHPCVNIKYIPEIYKNTNINNPRIISIFVFESGSITIAGSNSIEQIIEAYNFINKLILMNYNELYVKTITANTIIDLLKK
jgi:TATA-box binding protein (TBP) (component of TFIID and TFIIIB)